MTVDVLTTPGAGNWTPSVGILQAGMVLTIQLWGGGSGGALLGSGQGGIGGTWGTASYTVTSGDVSTGHIAYSVAAASGGTARGANTFWKTSGTIQAIGGGSLGSNVGLSSSNAGGTGSATIPGGGGSGGPDGIGLNGTTPGAGGAGDNGSGGAGGAVGNHNGVANALGGGGGSGGASGRGLGGAPGGAGGATAGVGTSGGAAGQITVTYTPVTAGAQSAFSCILA